MREEKKFTALEVREIVTTDFAMLKFFTVDMTEATIALLARMVPHKRALYWLRDQLVNHIGEWPGPSEVRGLLCTKFDPLDGIDQWCTLPGYSAQDYEAKSFELHEQIKMQERADGYVTSDEEMLPEIRKAVSKLKQIGAV